MYQDKKAERTFLELKAMIENFDKGDKEPKQKLGGRFSKKNRMRIMGINPTL
jgi:hypothetical protein